MKPARPGQAIWAGQISGAAKPGVQTYCWTPGILLSAIRAILYVVGSGLKGSRLRTTYLIMRSSTCTREIATIRTRICASWLFIRPPSQCRNDQANFKVLHDMPAASTLRRCLRSSKTDGAAAKSTCHMKACKSEALYGIVRSRAHTVADVV